MWPTARGCGSRRGSMPWRRPSRSPRPSVASATGSTRRSSGGRPSFPGGSRSTRRVPLGYEAYATFHPTFLYEALWNLALVALLILLDRKRVIRPGNLFVLYVLGYGIGRLWVESLRSDNASLILGIRINIWTSLLAIAGALIVLAVRGVRRRPDDDDEPYTDGHHWVDPDVVAPDTPSESTDDAESTDDTEAEPAG